MPFKYTARTDLYIGTLFLVLLLLAVTVGLVQHSWEDWLELSAAELMHSVTFWTVACSALASGVFFFRACSRSRISAWLRTPLFLKQMLLVATLLLLAGLVTPLFTTQKYFFSKNTFSMLVMLEDLLEHGNFILFAIILAFSIMIPLLKIVLLYRATAVLHRKPGRAGRYIHLMHEFGRWSMLDVLVVACTIVVIKVGGLVKIEANYGLYIFAASLLMLMYITNRVVKMSDRYEQHDRES